MGMIYMYIKSIKADNFPLKAQNNSHWHAKVQVKQKIENKSHNLMELITIYGRQKPNLGNYEAT